MSNRIQFRRDTAARWNSINPILQEGELGIETDTRFTKVGDGVHAWNDLSYATAVHNITHTLGTNENLVMSQKGIKDAIDKVVTNESTAHTALEKKITDLDNKLTLADDILEVKLDNFIQSSGALFPYQGNTLSSVTIQPASSIIEGGEILFNKSTKSFVYKVGTTYFSNWNTQNSGIGYQYNDINNGLKVRKDRLFVYQDRLYFFNGDDLVPIEGTSIFDTINLLEGEISSDEELNFLVEDNKGVDKINKIPFKKIKENILKSLENPDTPGIDLSTISLEPYIEMDCYALGDSTTYGVGSYNGQYSWFDRLINKIKFKSTNKFAVNDSSFTIYQNKGRFITQVQKVPESTSPNILILFMMGTNDKNNGIEFGDLNEALTADYSTLDDTENFCKSMRYGIETLKKRVPNATIIYMTPLTPRNLKNNQFDEEWLNASKKICELFSIPYIETQKVLGITSLTNYLNSTQSEPNEIPSNVNDFCFMSDQLHPNDLGYEKIANYMKWYLNGFVQWKIKI